MVTHNALFDMCICAWRYGFVPRLMVDTLGVSRAVLGHVLSSHSLAPVATHLGLGTKGSTIQDAVGVHLADLKESPLFYKEYIRYALNDDELCAGIFEKLVVNGCFPQEELLVMDMVLRCAVNPKFVLDRFELASHLGEVEAAKSALLARTTVGVDDLMSNNNFAAVLRTHGVEPPTKISKVTGKVTYAFAKTDPGLIALEEHEDSAVQALVAARVGHKSTLEESRTKRLISVANLNWSATGDPSGYDKCLAPVPLRYGAAHTHRLGGDWKLNYQNLGRKSRLKNAHKAPPGCTVINADAKQIEARGVATLCGQDDLVAQFVAGEDVYASFASVKFGRPISAKNDPGERFIGKIGVLQLGYGAGWASYQDALRVQSRSQLGYEITVDDFEAREVVDAFRARYPAIPRSWRVLNTTGIDVLAHGGSSFKFGPCEFEKGIIHGPNGLRLHYDNLERVDGEWWFTYNKLREKTYGGKLLENIIQFLARIATMQAGVRVQKRLLELDEELALQVHDSLVYVVRDEHVARVCEVLTEEMSRPLSWAPRWPLAVEIATGADYGSCK
jgi:DNA polymerase